MENIIVLTCSGPDQALAALDGLGRLHDAGDLRLEGGVVVERSDDGHALVLEQAEDVQMRATAAGGVIGGVIGLLGGPFGLLLGGATGAAVGSLVDIAEVESSDTVLRSFGSAVPPGHTATIAVIAETTPAPVDALASDLGADVLRRARADVELEIAEAEEAVIAEERDEETKRTIGDRLRDVKEAVVKR